LSHDEPADRRLANLLLKRLPRLRQPLGQRRRLLRERRDGEEPQPDHQPREHHEHDRQRPPVRQPRVSPHHVRHRPQHDRHQHAGEHEEQDVDAVPEKEREEGDGHEDGGGDDRPPRKGVACRVAVAGSALGGVGAIVSLSSHAGDRFA
jgi:hypothetical protein